jgi:hypothetical protein
MQIYFIVTAGGTYCYHCAWRVAYVTALSTYSYHCAWRVAYVTAGGTYSYHCAWRVAYVVAGGTYSYHCAWRVAYVIASGTYSYHWAWVTFLSLSHVILFKSLLSHKFPASSVKRLTSSCSFSIVLAVQRLMIIAVPSNTRTDHWNLYTRASQ